MKARATQWRETRDIESNPKKLQDWLQNSASRKLGPDNFDDNLETDTDDTPAVETGSLS